MYKKPSAAEKIAYFDTATTVLMVLTAAGLPTLALSVIATESSSLGGGVSVLGIGASSSSLLAKGYGDPDQRSYGDPDEVVLRR